MVSGEQMQKTYTQLHTRILSPSIKLQGDDRRKRRWVCVCVCWRRRGWDEINTDSRNAVFDTWKSCTQCPRHTLPLCAHETQSTTISSYAATLRGLETGEAVSRSEPPPRHPHSLCFVSSQCEAVQWALTPTDSSHSSSGKDFGAVSVFVAWWVLGSVCIYLHLTCFCVIVHNSDSFWHIFLMKTWAQFIKMRVKTLLTIFLHGSILLAESNTKRTTDTLHNTCCLLKAALKYLYFSS